MMNMMHSKFLRSAQSRSLRFVLVSLTLGALAALVGCGDKDVEKPAELVDIRPTLKVARVWSSGLGGGAKALRLALRPVAVGSVVYTAAHDGEVVALDEKNGRQIWSARTRLPLSAGPDVGGGLVVLGSSDGDVLALDATNGTERWRRSIGSEILARPLVLDDLIIIRTVDGHLEALSALDGSPRWALDEQVPRLTLRGTAPPVLAGDRIVTGFDNGRVLAVEPRSGEVLWDAIVNAPSGRTELERLADIDAPVRVDGNDVFVVGFQGRVAMLALSSGQIWWARDASSYRGFAMDKDNLYLTNADGVVVAMRRTDGAVLWEQDALKRRSLTAPALDGDALVLGDFEGFLHWLDKSTGEIVARQKTDGDRITNAPLATDAGVLVQTDSGRLIAFKSRPDPDKVAQASEAPAETQ
jgi:outer membrane protein assembly factor BamB